MTAFLLERDLPSGVLGPVEGLAAGTPSLRSGPPAVGLKGCVWAGSGDPLRARGSAPRRAARSVVIGTDILVPFGADGIRPTVFRMGVGIRRFGLITRKWLIRWGRFFSKRCHRGFGGGLSAGEGLGNEARALQGSFDDEVLRRRRFMIGPTRCAV